MKIVVDILLLLISHVKFNGFAFFDSLVNVLKEKFMVTFFDSENIVTIIPFKILNMRRIGTQSILIDNNLGLPPFLNHERSILKWNQLFLFPAIDTENRHSC